MKKTARWLVSIVLFLICGSLIFGRVNDILRVKTGQDADMMHCMYEQSNGGGMADVICIGSSHALCSFQSNHLWHKYGITSLAMSSGLQTVATSYYVLREALKHEKPKVVLLESYYFFRDVKYVDKPEQSQVRRAFDGLNSDEVKYAMLEDFFPDASLKEKLSFYIPFLKYHVRWDDLRDYDFNPCYYLRGSALVNKVCQIKDRGLPDQPTELPEVNKKYFEKILELCRENGIELVVYQAPYGCREKKIKDYMKKQGCNIALEPYLAELGVPFLFYQKSGEVAFDYSTDFMNAGHMNLTGGIKLTDHLGAWLQETYGLEDHRGDAAYHSYDEDYEQYCLAIENNVDTSE